MTITFNSKTNDIKKSILTILLLSSGCSYQDPALVAILRYFVSFSDQTYHFFFALKKDFLLDGTTFHLKSGAFP